MVTVSCKQDSNLKKHQMLKHESSESDDGAFGTSGLDHSNCLFFSSLLSLTALMLAVVIFISHLFLAHLAHGAKVSFWDCAVSVVRRRASTIYLNIFFSKTTDGKVIKLCIDVP